MKKLIVLRGWLSLALTAGVLSIAGSASASALEFSSKDGESSMRVTGRLDWDVDDFDASAIGGSNETNSELRRARISFKGKYSNSVRYELDLGYGENDTSQNKDVFEIKDAFIEYRKNTYSIKAGRFKVPFSMEALVSSSDLLTIERSAFLNTVPSGRGDISLQFGQKKKSVTWAVGIYGNNDGLLPEIESPNDGNSYSYAARVTWVPWKSKAALLHLGASGIRHSLDDNLIAGRLRSRLALHTANKFTLLDSRLNADDATQWGLEFAWLKGSYSVQGEYVEYAVDTVANSDANIELHAFSIQGAWSITGEKRRYKNGVLKGIRPKKSSRWGAWQLVGKYEFAETDYTSRTEYGLATLGVNWVLNRNLSLSLNYLNGQLDDGLGVDGSIKALSSRLRWSF